MQENNKNMHLVTDPLYFIIEEKQNSVELTDFGIEYISKTLMTKSFLFCRIWEVKWPTLNILDFRLMN